LATNSKDFRVKNGLVVEGSTATVNGSSVLTASSSINALSDVNTPSVSDGQVLIYQSGQWIPGSPGSGVTISTTAPTGTAGQMWFNSTTSRFYVYYDSYWVEAAAPVAAVGQFDGGMPSTTYGGTVPVDGGSV
jgi:hypothetical protein